MMTLVIGGSGSGKSAYAEKISVELVGQSNKYYLATMKVYDKEIQQKVERHRRLRSRRTGIFWTTSRGRE